MAQLKTHTKGMDYSSLRTILIAIFLLGVIVATGAVSPKTITKLSDAIIDFGEKTIATYNPQLTVESKFPVEYSNFENFAYEFILVTNFDYDNEDIEYDVFDYDSYTKFNNRLDKKELFNRLPNQYVVQTGCAIKGVIFKNYPSNVNRFDEFSFEPDSSLTIGLDGRLNQITPTLNEIATIGKNKPINLLLFSKPDELLCAKIDAGRYYYWFVCDEELAAQTVTDPDKNTIISNNIYYQCENKNGKYQWIIH